MNKNLQMRSHNWYLIMGEFKNKPLTDVEKQRIFDLKNEKEKLININGRKITWTENKQIEIDKLTEREKSKPELSETTKKNIEKIFKKDYFQQNSIEIDSIYLDKGIIKENSAIARVSKVSKVPLVKNMIEKSDQYGSGMIDARCGSIIYDTKCSHSSETFPLFESIVDEKYYWQMCRYLMLWQFEKGFICHCLENHPEEIIMKQSYKDWAKTGINEPMPESFIDDIREYYNYDHLEDNQRVKFFEVNLTSCIVEKMIYHYELANAYYQFLKTKLVEC